MHLLHIHSRKTKMRMSNGKPKLCDSWNLLGKLVGRGGFQAPRVVVRSSWFKRQEHRVLGVESMGLQKPQPTWPPIQALAFLSSISDHITTSYHTGFIRISGASPE